MLWVLIFAGIALAGLAVAVGYAVWLAHLAADVLSEVGVVTDRLGQLGDLLAQIEVPAVGVPGPAAPDWPGASEPVLTEVGSE